MALSGHCHRMLELRGKRAIPRDCRPAVLQNLYLVLSGIDHRLDREHPARIALPTDEDHRHVDAENVPFGQPLLSGDAVADHVIDGSADRFGKTTIVERRRNRTVPDDELVAEPVELLGCDTWPHM